MIARSVIYPAFIADAGSVAIKLRTEKENPALWPG